VNRNARRLSSATLPKYWQRTRVQFGVFIDRMIDPHQQALRFQGRQMILQVDGSNNPARQKSWYVSLLRALNGCVPK
jgi:hypothetical protein